MRRYIIPTAALILLAISGCHYWHYHHAGAYPYYSRAVAAPSYNYTPVYTYPYTGVAYYDHYDYGYYPSRYYDTYYYYPRTSKPYYTQSYPSRYYQSGGRYYRTPTLSTPVKPDRRTSFLRKLR